MFSILKRRVWLPRSEPVLRFGDQVYAVSHVNLVNQVVVVVVVDEVDGVGVVVVAGLFGC